ncbi:MAG: GpE family phage tail protein [Hydrogenovibrio crunogenus]|nr:GpE family phage tail protein [Hydrogenovibrio crunogenus]
MESWYADIAIVFHWPPSEMDSFYLEDLKLWRDEAEKRNTVDDEP